MSDSGEKFIPKVEKDDIKAPEIPAGGTAIVLQRHEKYNRDASAEDAGSITESEATIENDMKFVQDILAQEAADGVESVFMFVSSDTQYAGKGYRSMETGQLAQDAAVEVLAAAGLDPAERIINFNAESNTKGFEETGQAIRPMKGIVEPKMFDENPDFVKELGERFNTQETKEAIEARRTDVKLDPQAFDAYESDLPEVQEMRERHGGVEGVRDIVDRTKHSLAVLERYSKLFHHQNPNKRLVIWAASHYDTISPLVKDATDTALSEFVKVDYGGGVVIEVPPKEEVGELTLTVQQQKVALNLGRNAVSRS